MRYRRCFLLVVLLPLLSYAQDSTFFAAHPTLSPDGKEVYFSFDDDLWKVPAEGGEANRITALEGEAINPRVSPDGKWLAFTSNQYGNNDVFVLSLDHGEIKQLTFHQASDKVVSWSWDSQQIYFTSNRYNDIATYAINVFGGSPKPVFEGYFTNSDGLVELPSGAFLFTDSKETFLYPSRKRYKGANNADLLSFDPKTEDFKQLTTYEGNDFYPTVDKKGTIYYVSDEENDENNLYQLEEGNPKALTNFDTSIKRPQVSADGRKIVYEKNHQLYLYDVQSENETKIKTTTPTHYKLDKAQDFDVNTVQALDVSPDQKKLAFVSRGVLFVSDHEGDFITEIVNNGERVKEVKWLANNEDLLFSQTYKGFPNWYKVSAKGGESTPVTEELRSNRDLTFNSDTTKAVYLSGRDKVKLLDLKTFETETIVEDELWGFQNSAPSFSPDGKYVLFTAIRDFEQDIFVHHIEQDNTINITNTGVTEADPDWSPDGKYIYFTSNRTTPSYPFGLKESSIYRMSLDWYAEDFETKGYEALFTEKNDKEADKSGDVSINFDDLDERIERVSTNFGTQNNPKSFSDDKKTVVFYNSDQDGGSHKLYKTVYEPYKQPKTDRAANSSARNIIQANGKYFIQTYQGIYTYNESQNKLDKISMSKKFEKNLEKEFYQMFEETWAGMDENFYDDEFHGVDWPKIKKEYSAYLPYVRNRSNLRVLLNDMLGELNSSHQGFNSTGKEERTKLDYHSNETGILFKKDKPFEVDRIVNKSPAKAKHINLKAGDVLVAVNGKKVSDSLNREHYFTTPKQKEELRLTFKRDGKPFKVDVKTISSASLKNLLYDEWIVKNRKNVKDWSEDRIGYAYMKNMSEGELESFLHDMVDERNNREGLIIDLRYNTGGNVHDKVLNFLAQRPYLKWKYRGGKKTTQSNFSPSAKPIVLLINRASLSDAEMTAAGFKELGLGTVIGTETYRWIIFTSAKGLVDNSSFRVPAWGTYTLEGNNLEKTGVAPDIEVHNTFLDKLNEEDPQLERAVEEVLKEI